MLKTKARIIRNIFLVLIIFNMLYPYDNLLLIYNPLNASMCATGAYTSVSIPVATGLILFYVYPDKINHAPTLRSAAVMLLITFSALTVSTKSH